MNEILDELLESDEPVDEIQRLTWAMIDEHATETDIARLEELLLHDEEARRTYVMCMQMHADLHFLLGGKRPSLPDIVALAQKAEQAKKAEQPKTSRSPLPLVNLPSPSALPLAGEFA
jgi:hypothetical protein